MQMGKKILFSIKIIWHGAIVCFALLSCAPSPKRPLVSTTVNTVSTPLPTATGSQTATPTPTGTGTSTPTPTPTATSGGGSGDDCANPGPGVGSSNFPYHKLGIIKFGHDGLSAPYPDGEHFASTVDLPSDSQGIFDTDTKLRIRLKAKPNPGGSPGAPSPGCRWPFEYTQLQLRVGVRASNNPPFGTYHEQFNVTVPVNSCSITRDISNVPNVSGSNHIAIDVWDAKSDWQCVQYPGNSYYCTSLQYESKDSCWEIELHVETDYTKSIP